MRSAARTGALGVVLMRNHRPAVALDLLPQPGVVGADASPDVLGIGCVRGGGEADQVAEEDGDNLALFLDRSRRMLGQRRRTEGAEGKVAGRELLIATWTGLR